MMITLFFCLIVIVLSVYFFKQFRNKKSEVFVKQGIPFKKPLASLPFLTKSISDVFNDIYKLFPNDRVFGLFQFFEPYYYIRDPEIVKQLLIKDFDHFTDRRSVVSENSLFAKGLSLLTGQKWKDMRTTLSPAFTGSKMRQMLELINDCSSDLVKHFQKNSDDTICVEMEDTFTRFTNDVIATCAFGIKINSLDDRDNEFFTMGRKLMIPNQIIFITKAMLITACPKIANFFKLKLFDGGLDRFFRSLIIDTMAVRERENIYRPDMIHLLMQIRKQKLTDDEEKDQDIFSNVSGAQEKIKDGKIRADWTDDELVAQCLLFFIAGFFTTSTVLSTLSYELAINPEIQEKLIEEIDKVYEKNNGKLIYESLQSMKYLGMVVSEGLRKWPPSVFLERVCVKSFKYEDPTGLSLNFDKGTFFFAPIHAFHHDPKYFPNPDKFDPERFNEENIGNIVPFTYLPFGGGPRNCIASRFALMQMKAVMFYLLKNFRIEVTEKTEIPLKLTGVFLKSKNGIHLRLRKRS